MTLALHREAEADILEAFRWYESKQLGLGNAFVAEVDEALARLVEGPSSFAVVYREMRRLVLRRFPYVIYFRQSESVVQVLGVLHGRRHRRRLRQRTAEP